MRASVAWRALVVFSTAVALVSLVLGPVLWKEQTNQADENRSTICSIGSFLTGAPVVRVAGTPREAFVGQLVATRAFLRDLRELDCSKPGLGKAVTAEAIARQLRRIRREIRRQREAVGRDRARDIAEAATGSASARDGPVVELPTTASTSSSPAPSSPPSAGGSEGGPGAPDGAPGGPGPGTGTTTPGPTDGGPGGSEPPGPGEQIGQAADQALGQVEGIVCPVASAPGLCPP